MNNKRCFIGLSILSLCLLIPSSKAQEESIQTEKEIPSPVIPIKKTQEDKIESVILIINQDDINKILVVGSNGRWVPEARSINMDANIGNVTSPIVKCTMYKGLFKPTKPEIKVWPVKTIMTVSKDDFQKSLDSLQNGEFENDN